MEKTEIRIVAGTLKGRKVICHVHPGMRPTPQMVREALFSILGNAVPGRAFYDIFAGTGVVGLEAVSRGAPFACLIESDPKQWAAVQRHAEKFGIADKVQVLRADAYRWAERWIPPKTGPVNIFLSPPFSDLDETKLEAFMALVNLLWAKAPDESVLVLQTEDNFPPDAVPDPASWDIRNYGRNTLMFRVKEATPPAPPAASPPEAGGPEGGA